MKNFRKALALALSATMLFGCGESNNAEVNPQVNISKENLEKHKQEVTSSFAGYKLGDLTELKTNNYYINALSNEDGFFHGYEVKSIKDSYLVEDEEELSLVIDGNTVVNNVSKLYVTANPFINKIKGEISIKNYGVMEFELYPDVAPRAVENFKRLVEDNFYDGLIMHRIADLYDGDYVIQGGGFTEDLKQKTDFKSTGGVIGEFLMNGYYNPLNHGRGVMAMARSQAYNSATTQFYLVQNGCEFLDTNYTTFGKITTNLELLDILSQVEVNESSLPLENVVIEYVKLK